MVVYTPLKIVNREVLTSMIKRQDGFTCTVPYAGQATEGFISHVLSVILDSLKRAEFSHPVVYFIRELVANASKANAKRVYFSEKKYDISHKADYDEGIKTFKREVFSNFDLYASRLKESGFFIELNFKIEGDCLNIRVTNNSRLCPEEEARITERLSIVKKVNSLEEILDYGFDDSEGGGLGLVIGILMLRRVGLSETAFSIRREGTLTTAVLKIPINLLTKGQSLMIAKEIAGEVERMPQFPESVVRLSKELGDYNADFTSVAAIIKTDPSLTTEIIRIANSPIYRLPKKVADVFTAVKMIGLDGVKNLVLSFGVNHIFSRLYKKEKIDLVMEHSYKVAVYSTQLAKQKRLDNLIDDIYIGSLLHDFGKIITKSFHSKLAEKLNAICRVKNIPAASLEELTNGFNHALIGSLLAEKWNFPEKFVQCVKFHHAPLEGDSAHKAVIFTCYLGNELCHFFQGERSYHDIDYQVLKFFGLETEEQFLSAAHQLQNEARTADVKM